MTKTFSRVLPIDQSIVLENFFDPAHIPFAHHGMQVRCKNPKKTHKP
jgi:phenylpropionate dioxygenase-like ring-hydroxylating dioxygenase large terminal subunit